MGNLKPEDNIKKDNGGTSLKESRESKCPFINRPKIIKLNRLEEFCAVLIWNA